VKYTDPVVVQSNGFGGSAMANAPDGDGVTGLTVDATRAWALRKATELGVEVEDRLPRKGGA
jgi:hypothetical protein